MANKLSILFALIGIFICLYSLVFSDHIVMFGLLSIVVSAVIFILNWNNGLRSILVAIYVVVIVGSILGSDGFVFFEEWYKAITLLVLPIVCLITGIGASSDSLLISLKEGAPYIICILSICLGNFMLILVAASGV